MSPVTGLFSRKLTRRATLATFGVVLAIAIGAVAVSGWIEARRDVIGEVPGLGSFVIRNPDDIIQSWLLHGEPWEPKSVLVFNKVVRPGMNVADIGAYNGVHSIRFANLVGPAGHVYSFEPNPAARDMLLANIRLNSLGDRISVYPVGAAEKASTAKIVSPNPNNLGGTNLCSPEDIRAHERGCEAAATEQSVMVRIDDDIAHWFPKRVSFVKIDVEGYEDRVLAGAREWLKRDRPMIWIEIWDDAHRQEEHMPRKAKETIALIESMGYKIALFNEPWDYLFVPVPEMAGTVPAAPPNPDGGQKAP